MLSVTPDPPGFSRTSYAPTLHVVPTPVGPLGPGEFDPNDPDLWGDWEDAPATRSVQSAWVRAIAVLVVVAFVALTIAAFFR